jgi:hypothetical protein
MTDDLCTRVMSAAQPAKIVEHVEQDLAAVREECVKSAAVALARVPRTESRVLWQTAPEACREIADCLKRFVAARGTVRAFARRLDVPETLVARLRDNRTPDGRRLGSIPIEEAHEAVIEAAKVVAGVRAATRQDGTRRINWVHHPEAVAALQAAWRRSCMSLTAFAREVNLDATSLRLHFREHGECAHQDLVAAEARARKAEGLAERQARTINELRAEITQFRAEHKRSQVEIERLKELLAEAGTAALRSREAEERLAMIQWMLGGAA